MALEVLTLAGTPTPILWKFSKTGNPATSSQGGVSGLVDCLYEEPRIPSTLTPAQIKAGLSLYTPYSVLCYFERPQFVIDTTDNGLSERTEGKFWLSRKNLENVGVPTNSIGYHVWAGDIIEIWQSYKKISWYFEVINAERDGFEHDSQVWTHYEITAVRNENFTPEQKIAQD